ncbi:hypothetical protein AC249_AIPGENE28064 [Exaiptasia diaphana]|nr:hypothetical protein AC249_AIPGENE28064 [Exaiptasia diaphana]
MYNVDLNVERAIRELNELIATNKKVFDDEVESFIVKNHPWEDRVDDSFSWWEENSPEKEQAISEGEIDCLSTITEVDIIGKSKKS